MIVVYVGNEDLVRRRIDELRPSMRAYGRCIVAGTIQGQEVWQEAHAYFVLKGQALVWSAPNQPKVVVQADHAVFWKAGEWFAIETAMPGTELFHASDANVTPERYFTDQSDLSDREGEKNV